LREVPRVPARAFISALTALYLRDFDTVRTLGSDDLELPDI